MADDGMSCSSRACASTSMMEPMSCTGMSAVDDTTTITDDLPATQNTSFNQDRV